MSLKVFLFLAPVALGGYYVASREAAPTDGNGVATAKVATKAAAPRKSREECRVLMEGLLEANAPRSDNPFEQMAIIRGVERELRNQGCDTRGPTSFEAPRAAMGPAPRAGDPAFEPGRPMVDVSRNR